MHAACLSHQVGRVTVRNSIGSWTDDVVARPTDIHAISHVIPSALATYDLPDLTSVLGDRLTIE